MIRIPRQTGPGTPVLTTASMHRPADTPMSRCVEALRVALRVTQAALPFHIDAMVVLPDRICAVWILPPGDTATDARWAMINQALEQSSPGAPIHVSIEPKTAPRRAAPPGNSQGNDLIRYCLDAPVRHGISMSADDWPHSSIHHTKIGAAGKTPTDCRIAAHSAA